MKQSKSYVPTYFDEIFQKKIKCSSGSKFSKNGKNLIFRLFHGKKSNYLGKYYFDSKNKCTTNRKRRQQSSEIHLKLFLTAKVFCLNI